LNFVFLLWYAYFGDGFIRNKTLIIMKKTLLLLLLLNAGLHLDAQTTIFEETFESSVGVSFPSGWGIVDRSNSFSPWIVTEDPNYYTMGFSGKVAAILPGDSSDQLLISPVINLSTGDSFSLNFLIGKNTYGGIFPSVQHYAIYVLPEADSFTGSEIPVLEEDISTADVAESKTVDLSGYAGQNVRIYFRQYNSSGEFGTIILDTIQVMQLDQLGTSEVKQESAVGIYPNPTSDYVYFKSKSKITKADVYDMAGRKLNVELDHERLNVKDLQPGTYIIASESENKKSTHKLIKK
jgi:hypothetical protein